MGERKVLNKYYPPDFDPAKVPRLRRPENHQIKSIRMMLPMSIRCKTCGHYIYKGTKFNSRKENVAGETYLGIQILRFYFKCTNCSAELTMKTDPQNSDYIVESGATRNYEPWRAEGEADSGVGDAMRSLENRALESKREMDIDAGLEELKSLKARREDVGVDAVLDALQRKKVEEEDELLVKSIVFDGSKGFVRRIEEDDDFDDNVKRRKISNEHVLTKAGSKERFVFKSSSVRVSVIKKPAVASKIVSDGPAKREDNKKEDEKGTVKADGSANNELLSLFQGYGSSDEE